MKALRIDGPLDIEIVDVPAPEPADGEVLVRVARAGICATDRRLAARGSEPPRIPGHEVAGWLDDTLVGIHPDIGCGECPQCLAGYENRCPARIPVGLDRDGGMAEWLVVPERHVLAVSDLDPDVATLLEPLACCVHAVGLLEAGPETRALVVGAGPMGILAMWAFQAAGARVAVCQTSATRRRAAADLGADGVLDPEGDLEAILGGAPTAAIVTAPGGRALRWALEHMEPGGRVHVFAGSVGGADLDANVIHYGHLALVGSTGSALRDYRQAYAYATAGDVPLDRLPRVLVSLEEAADSLRREEPAKVGKTVIDLRRASAG